MGFCFHTLHDFIMADPHRKRMYDLAMRLRAYHLWEQKMEVWKARALRHGCTEADRDELAILLGEMERLTGRRIRRPGRAG
jgi:hypothetical protein